jgi:hypothetical protein
MAMTAAEKVAITIIEEMGTTVGIEVTKMTANGAF